jgi:hypothetical protein
MFYITNPSGSEGKNIGAVSLLLDITEWQVQGNFTFVYTYQCQVFLAKR